MPATLRGTTPGPRLSRRDGPLGQAAESAQKCGGRFSRRQSCRLNVRARESAIRSDGRVFLKEISEPSRCGELWRRGVELAELQASLGQRRA